MFVHERGNRSLDGLFRLIEVAGQPWPLPDVLSAMCEQVAAIAGADVASIYVRDDVAGEPGFTLCANVGFPAEAVGRVRLRLGEGIVGFVAERARPVSVDMAERDEHFKYVPGLGEERFPALLAVPVMRGGATAAAVLVLQRTAAATFTSEEVVLATALAAVTSHALERAEARDRERERDSHRTVARLRGVALSGEAAMGRAEILPTLAALAGTTPPSLAPGRAAFETIARRLRADLERVRAGVGVAFATELTTLALLLDDRRFCDGVEAATAAVNPWKALSELAREYARVPFRTGGDDETAAALMIDRASAIEDLCVLVHAALSGRPLVRAGSIVVAERLRVFSALAAIASGASAFVLETALSSTGLVAEIVRLSGRPLLTQVEGVFAWVRPGDLLVVDAETASVRVNPEATAVARFRTRRD
ncbi:MAG TPA: GAF domain-containing protein [Polyangia bacterium]|nr:GAF domain-containing protein [Polyangia bacterium]